MCSAADMSPEKAILFRLPIAKFIAQIYRNFIGQRKQKLILKQPSEAGKHQYLVLWAQLLVKTSKLCQNWRHGMSISCLACWSYSAPFKASLLVSIYKWA